jgi:hypothetical protein
VQFDGFGYAWTPLPKKVTFTSAASIRYDQEFKSANDSAIDAHFDAKAVPPPDGPAGAARLSLRFSDIVRAAGEYPRALPVGAGMYYMVIDNKRWAGLPPAHAPLPGVVSDAVAVVSYGVHIGDAS